MKTGRQQENGNFIMKMVNYNESGNMKTGREQENGKIIMKMVKLSK